MWFQKISIPIPRAASWNSEGEAGGGGGGLHRVEFQGHGGGSLDCNSKGMEEFSGLNFQKGNTCTGSQIEPEL